MRIADLGEVQLHYQIDGDPFGAPVIFANALGTDLRIWEAVRPLLPPGLKLIRYDMRGHGLSSVPVGPYSMGALIRDAEQLIVHLGLSDCVFVGASMGGMIAQGLAVKRLDLVRAIVLSNTAAKIGTPEIWAKRIAEVETGGVAAIADAVIERWFTKAFRAAPDVALWRNMLIRQPAQGYTGCATAISGTDFYTPTSGLRLPTLGLAGNADGATPPDLVRETVDLIPGAQFHLIRKAGHLPCIEQPQIFAQHLTRFLTEIGHV